MISFVSAPLLLITGELIALFFGTAKCQQSIYQFHIEKAAPVHEFVKVICLETGVKHPMFYFVFEHGLYYTKIGYGPPCSGEHKYKLNFNSIEHKREFAEFHCPKSKTGFGLNVFKIRMQDNIVTSCQTEYEEKLSNEHLHAIEGNMKWHKEQQEKEEAIAAKGKNGEAGTSSSSGKHSGKIMYRSKGNIERLPKR